jgi:2-(1,2-epoxy-1,2-dihydrophenyl)acetyl-CoA isomerase
MSAQPAPVVSAPLLEHLDGAVLTLTLNRPARLNAITPELLDSLGAALDAAAANDSVRALIITGAGRGFCSGQDLRYAVEAGGLDVQTVLRDHYAPVIRAMRSLEKPIIAAVNGVAAGAGFSLALAADFRIAAESATFVQAFVRIGLVPDMGST